MQTLLSLSRLILPAGFLVYAIAANVAVIDRQWARLNDADGRWLNGEIASAVGNLYETALPHRDLAQGWIGAARYVLAGEGRDGVAVGQDGWLFTAEETRLADYAQIRRAVDYITAVDRRLAEIGTDLVVVPVPAKLDIARRAAAEWLPVDGMKAQYAQFVQILEDRRIPVVDTRPALSAADAPQTPAFLRTDTHWSPRGAAAVADAVAASGLVAGGDEAFRRVEDSQTSFTGDLVSFVTTDAMAPRLGLTQETVLPWVAEAAAPAGAGIFAADAAPPAVVLVGTSYSANPNWSFGPALTLALNRPILNLAEEGQGPIRPMARFLDGRGMDDPPPATVIWEFPVRYLSDPDIWMDGEGTLASATSGGASDG